MEIPSYQKAKDKMATGRHHISIITLNVNGLNSPIKSTGLQNGSKNKTQPYTASRRHISAPKTNTDSKWKGGIFQANGIQRKEGGMVLISIKIKKTETQGQGNNGNTELPESKR